MSAVGDAAWPDDVAAAVTSWRQRHGGVPAAVARAPGRLDVLGGIADYSGSAVLERPIAEAVVAIVHRHDDERLQLRSDAIEGADGAVDLPMSPFRPGGEASTVDGARRLLGRDRLPGWTPYVAGVFALLVQESELLRGAGLVAGGGLSIELRSRVPDGKGVSSSAAVELATAGALLRLAGLSMAPARLAALCQRVENRVVGAPCGLMDQMTVALGRANALFALHCVPDRVLPAVAMASGYAVWGIDSGVRHAVTGADYGAVRTGAFMGYRLLLEAAGVAPATLAASAVNDTRWHGYLANVTPEELDGEFADVLPARLSGRDFLARFDGITDEVTRVDPAREYPVLAPTRFPILEHRRVLAFADSMRALSDTSAEAGGEAERRTRAVEMGRQLYRSHEGYGACGLGSAATDALVRAVRETGPGRGLFGARISGGGSGGTVAVFGREEAEPLVREIAARHRQASGAGGQVFAGGSDGLQAWLLAPSSG